MASAATQQPFAPGSFASQGNHYSQVANQLIATVQTPKIQPRDVTTILNYFKDNEDGSPPAPSYVGKPETYSRPTLPQQAVVHDIRGSEDQYTLDTKGFQIVKHQSQEKEFVDDDQIRRIYYPETEELLKAA